MIDERYPIGEFEFQPYTESLKHQWLADIQFLPEEIEQVLLNLDEAQLHIFYRNGGWTIHEVVHHLADSHMNAYCRFKLGLTEDSPIIKPYDENAWTALNDVKTLPVNISVTLLHALHTRWHFAIKDLTLDQWERTVYHPGSKKEMSLWYLLGMYAWHGKHHTAHIRLLREKNNW